MSIPVRTALLSGKAGETPGWRLFVANPTLVSEPAFLEIMSAKAHQSIVESRYWLDNFRLALFACLAENKAVDLGFMYARLYATGKLSSMNDQPTKENNPVKAGIYFKGEFADEIANLELVNDSKTVEAVMYELQQDNAPDVNMINSTIERIVINGSRIKIGADEKDTGIWIEGIKNGERVANGTIDYSDSSVCHVTFSQLPPSGRYRLVLVTRNGENPDEYSPSRLTRNVTVVNEEVSHG